MEPATSEVTARATVRGRVQGVGYRQFLLAAALAHGVRGWARNRADGTVELTAQGPRSAIEALLAAARQGPPFARVDALDVVWSTAIPSLPARFELRASE